ncbi:MAG TPA: hypothetical protein VK994_03190 [Bacteroidales bacterium]|nr:hypothetical protein [Bacteroidales bacterium]
MKTLKLSLIVAFLAVAMAGFANMDSKPLPAKKVVKITLAQALSEPGLVDAIRQQVSISSLLVEPNGLYVATVNYTNVVYKIYGTREAWVKFFLNKKKKVSLGNPNNGVS